MESLLLILSRRILPRHCEFLCVVSLTQRCYIVDLLLFIDLVDSIELVRLLQSRLKVNVHLRFDVNIVLSVFPERHIEALIFWLCLLLNDLSLYLQLLVEVTEERILPSLGVFCVNVHYVLEHSEDYVVFVLDFLLESP